MKFVLVDKIQTLVPSQRIVTIKALSLAEEYLGDHFPAFPVLPGVLMIESLVQAAAWLTRVHQNVGKSMIVLSGARNVRYASFVQPGDLLRCEVDAVEIADNAAKFKGNGFVGERLAVSARIELRCFNLADRQKYLADADRQIISQMRRRFELIGGPAALAASGALSNG